MLMSTVIPQRFPISFCKVDNDGLQNLWSPLTAPIAVGQNTVAFFLEMARG